MRENRQNIHSAAMRSLVLLVTGSGGREERGSSRERAPCMRYAYTYVLLDHLSSGRYIYSTASGSAPTPILCTAVSTHLR